MTSCGHHPSWPVWPPLFEHPDVSSSTALDFRNVVVRRRRCLTIIVEGSRLTVLNLLHHRAGHRVAGIVGNDLSGVATGAIGGEQGPLEVNRGGDRRFHRGSRFLHTSKHTLEPPSRISKSKIGKNVRTIVIASKVFPNFRVQSKGQEASSPLPKAGPLYSVVGLSKAYLCLDGGIIERRPFAERYKPECACRQRRECAHERRDDKPDYPVSGGDLIVIAIAAVVVFDCLV